MGLKARIWASMLGFRPRDWDLGLMVGFRSRGGGTEEKKKEKEKEKEEEEKIPHMCESIGH